MPAPDPDAPRFGITGGNVISGASVADRDSIGDDVDDMVDAIDDGLTGLFAGGVSQVGGVRVDAAAIRRNMQRELDRRHNRSLRTGVGVPPCSPSELAVMMDRMLEHGWDRDRPVMRWLAEVLALTEYRDRGLRRFACNGNGCEAVVEVVAPPGTTMPLRCGCGGSFELVLEGWRVDTEVDERINPPAAPAIARGLREGFVDIYEDAMEDMRNEDARIHEPVMVDTLAELTDDERASLRQCRDCDAVWRIDQERPCDCECGDMLYQEPER